MLRTVPPGIEKRWIRRIVYLLESAYLAELLDAKKVQHLHNHIAENSAVVAMLAAMFQGIPYSLTIQGRGEFDRPTLLALDEKIRRAAFVVTISQFTRSQLLRWSDYRDWSKIRVIYAGVNPVYLEHGPAPIPEAPRLVNIGRIVEQKGQAILIHAAARLREAGAMTSELVIVGDGPMRGEIEQLHRPARPASGRYDSPVTWMTRESSKSSWPPVPWSCPASPRDCRAYSSRPWRWADFRSSARSSPGHAGTDRAGRQRLAGPGRRRSSHSLARFMAEALMADPAELDRMGRVGAARVAEQHNALTEATKLAFLFTNPDAIANHSSQHAFLPGTTASGKI